MTKIEESLAGRRSYYQLTKDMPVSAKEVTDMVEHLTELTPDAFNMSARVVVALGDKSNQLWDAVYDAFDGKVAREKIDSFKAAGTVLYFYDKSVVEGLQEKFALYAQNFPVWANQSNGMLQLAIWSGLRELGLGASLQHYNPVIDDAVRKLFNLPDDWVLVAEMPFGGIVAEPAVKEAENIADRVKVFE